MDNITKLYYNKAVNLQEQYNSLVQLFESVKNIAFWSDAELDEWARKIGKDRQEVIRLRGEFRKKRAEAQKAQKAPKAEAPKAEAPKVEVPKVEVPKAEAPKAEAPKVEAPKAEAPKATSVSPSETRGSAKILDGSKVKSKIKYFGKSAGSLAPALIGFGVGDVAGQVLSNELGIEGELPREAISSTTAGTGLAAGESIIPAASAAKQAGLRAGASSLIRGTMAAAPVGIGLAGGFAAGEKAAENILDYAGVENETARFAGKSAGGLAGGVPGAAIASGLVGGGKALATGAGLKGAAVAGKAAALAGAAAAAKTAGIGAVAVGGYLLGDYIGDKTGLHKAIGDYLGGADKLTEKPTGVVGGDPAINAKNAREEKEEEERRREMDKKYIAKSKRKLVEEILEKRKAEKQTTK